MATAEELQTLEAIKKNCEVLTKELHTGKVNYRDQSNLPIKLKVLQEKERAYKAEIDITKEQHITSLPGYDVHGVRGTLHEELMRLLVHLDQYQSELQTIYSSRESHLLRESELLHEHEQINKMLKDKLEKSLAEKPEKTENQQTLDGVATRLFKFLEKYYPVPVTEESEENDEENTSKKRKKIVSDFSSSNGKSLLELLKILISTYPTPEEDEESEQGEKGYLDIRGYWRPYVQLLLAAGVAYAHPLDNNFIRLTDYE